MKYLYTDNIYTLIYQHMFTKFTLDFQANLFERLANSVHFEDITNGRKGTILVDCKNNLIPIVRTTTIYQTPNQKFLQIHHDIINKIRKISDTDLQFNNALIEIYNSNYRSMKFHSDQSLDLNKNSYICLFSCYINPLTTGVRKLKIKNKTTDECSNVLLSHNSIVLFSTATNRQHLHKIVLESKSYDDLWLGITFRLSKTFIYFLNELPYFSSNNERLMLATDEQKKEFYKYRGLENLHVESSNPDINYTISVGDMLMIK